MLTWEENGKIFAKIEDLRLWPKNYKRSTEKGQKMLEHSFNKFGVFDPLKVTPDGEILGGNQRFIKMQELAKTDDKYKKVWVEIVDLWTDQERYEFCLIDNYQAGEINEEDLVVIARDLLKQGSLFKEMDIQITNPDSLTEVLKKLSKTKEERKSDELEEILKKAGIADDIINDVKIMSNCGGKFEEAKIENGSGVCAFNDKKVYMIKLFFEYETDYNEMLANYQIKGNAFEKTKNLLTYVNGLEKFCFKEEMPNPVFNQSSDFNGGIII